MVQVREETGLDISDMLVEEDCIERHIKQQRSKLYIITGVRTSMHLTTPSLPRKFAGILTEERYNGPLHRRVHALTIGVLQVEETTEFEPQVRGEIGAFGWHFVTSLPASEEAAMQYNTAEGARHHFYQVYTAATLRS